MKYQFRFFIFSYYTIVTLNRRQYQYLVLPCKGNLCIDIINLDGVNQQNKQGR